MLTGYSDRLVAHPEETIRFMVSSPSGDYDVQFYRVFHGDRDPSGPGERLVAIDAPANGRHRGAGQGLVPGSYIAFPASDHLALAGDFTIFLWVFPTLINGHQQVLMSRRSDEGEGHELGLDGDGRFFFQSGVQRIEGPILVADRWQWICVSGNAATLTLTIRVGLHPRDLPLQTCATVTSRYIPPMAGSVPLYLAARVRLGLAEACFNGRIACPAIYAKCLSEEAAGRISRISNPDDFLAIPGLLAAWDFNIGHATTGIHDAGPHGLHGTTHQRPVRALTGPHWSSEVADVRFDAKGYSAIHFHEDALVDAGWAESFSFTVPGDLPSGVYTARLSADGAYDDLPFFVSPPVGAARAEVAFLVPTFSYMAYGNYPDQEIRGIKCLYNLYEDGHGVPHASALHPLPSMRLHRGSVLTTQGHAFARHLSADLYFLNWANDLGLDLDVITDHDLHAHGADLLKPYKGVFTGSHPEYVSGKMLDALEAHVDAGGSIAYTGGNGFYWVTSPSPDGTFIEVRRPNGSRNWTALPGEANHALTGEISGLWRLRGRAPQRLVGVGFTSQGYDVHDHAGPARPHRQMSDRTDPLAAAILDGVPTDLLIGDYRTLGIGHGTAGDEVDRMDHRLGTPLQATLLARADGFETMYQPVIEDVRESNQLAGSGSFPGVRSDIVAFTAPAGGFVFATGTMQWFSALWYQGHRNTTSRITENVFRLMKARNNPT